MQVLLLESLCLSGLDWDFQGCGNSLVKQDTANCDRRPKVNMTPLPAYTDVHSQEIPQIMSLSSSHNKAPARSGVDIIDCKNGHKAQTDIRMYFQPTKNRVLPSVCGNGHSETVVNVHGAREEDGRGFREKPMDLGVTAVNVKGLSHEPVRDLSSSRHYGGEKSLESHSSRVRNLNAQCFPRPGSIIDPALMPKPLRLNTVNLLPVIESPENCSPLASDDECVLMSAAIDTKGSLRKSMIMSIFEKQGLGIEPTDSMLSASTTLSDQPYKMGSSGNSTAGTNCLDTEAAEPVIYFLPSPSPPLRSPLAWSKAERTRTAVPPRLKLRVAGDSPDSASYSGEKARRIVGNEYHFENIRAAAPRTLFSCQLPSSRKIRTNIGN